jgi:undecaprenyl pyrophosphate phosphatase UppP
MCIKCILLPIIMTIPFMAVGMMQKKGTPQISLEIMGVLFFAIVLGGVIVFLLFFDKKTKKEKGE